MKFAYGYEDISLDFMMEALCTAFCEESNYGGFESILYPSSCLNTIFIVFVDIILLFMFFLYFIIKQSPRTNQLAYRFQRFSPLQISSSIFNGGLGLIYLGIGIRIVEEKLRNEYVLLPIHLGVVMLFHGLTWFLMGLILSLRERLVQESFVKLWSIFATLYAGFLCASSLLVVFVDKEVSVNVVLNVLSLPGAVLLLFCTIKGKGNIGTTLYIPLNNEANTSTSIDLDYNVSTFANAGFLSRILFWWLNPLMKKGKEKILDDQDIPGLCEDHQAETCYLLFNQKLNIQKERKPSTPASILWTLTSTHLKEIMISGFFALLKTLALSSGPLFLNAFIDVSEGKESFRYEGYTLCGGLFLVKISESLFQNQWYFRSEIVGLQVRSALLAAIYKKQLRLSNSAKAAHSSGEIMSYVTVDAYKIGEFPFRFHRIWTTTLQISIALVILVHALGLATMAALLAITLSVLCNTPLGKLQHKYLSQLLMAQDKRLKATSEALINMKVLKLYAWETHFKKVIENLRKDENKWLRSIQKLKSYFTFLFLASPTVVSVATFLTCYLLGVPLSARNIFTFVATLRLVQEPIREVPDVIEAVIQAKVSLERIVRFLNAPELESRHIERKCKEELKHSIFMKSANFSWEESSSKTSLRNISFEAKPSQKIAICGEVGSGKSTLLAAILGEVPITDGTIQVYGTIAYVSQTSWIQSGTIQENILFGSRMDKNRYKEALEKCSLEKDLEMLVFGDLTEIGERGITLSGGQKQRIQLARALYQDADLYLLDDPFSAVDAHTAKCLFNDYVLGALSRKTVLLVTHQVDFLPALDSILLMSDGEILHISPYHHLLVSSQEFQDLVNAQKDIIESENVTKVASERLGKSRRQKRNKTFTERELKALVGNQLIKQEEREVGDTGLKPYKQYLNQKKSCLYFSFACLCHLIFTLSQILQNFWMADNVENSDVSRLRLVLVYLVIASISAIFLLLRSLSIRSLCFQSSKSFFSQLLNSLFRAPMFFYDSTPLGRILVRVSSDLSVVDLDVPFKFLIAVSATMNTFANLGVLVFLTWQVLIVAIPMVYLTIRLQRYYFASAKELMRINGTTKSLVVNHLAESIAGSMTIRAFEEQERFFNKSLELIDKNATPLFHNFAANEWLIQRLEIVSAIVLCFSALAIVLNPPGTFGSGFVGMALSSGLSLNMFLVYSIQFQCTLANDIISVERLSQYMYLPSEAPKSIKGNRPTPSWPGFGKVEIQDLKIRYRPNTPFVLHGISCSFEGGQNIGIVGRTGSGKTTLIGALFRLVEPSGGKIVIDGTDIATVGLHDLRSRLSIIPQEPILFQGTVRYNLDPLEEYTDQEIWKVLEKCQLQEVVQEKQQGLDYHVAEDGSNWSMGQRQLFCLGRALLRRSRIMVLDEATASIDNTTDLILQKTVRAEFEDCTVITVAHRIPTVIDCNMVLSMSDGKLVEYDDPMKLMKREGSLFGQLVREYWSQTAPTTMLP